MRLAATALFAIIVCVAACDSGADRAASERSDSVIHRLVKYGFSVTNPSGRQITDVSVSVRAPLSVDGVQRLVHVGASAPFVLETTGDGQQQMRFTFAQLPPYSIKDVWVTAEVELNAPRAQRGSPDGAAFLGESRFVQVRDARIATQVEALKTDDTKTSLLNAHAWIIENVADLGYVKEDRGATYALTERKGDCTEQAYLFMAMSRALGVPARGVAGFVQANDGVVFARDYHNWVEVLIDGVWRAVDPLREKFMVEEASYVALAFLESDEETSQGFFTTTGDAIVQFK